MKKLWKAANILRSYEIQWLTFLGHPVCPSILIWRIRTLFSRDHEEKHPIFSRTEHVNWRHAEDSVL